MVCDAVAARCGCKRFKLDDVDGGPPLDAFNDPPDARYEVAEAVERFFALHGLCAVALAHPTWHVLSHACETVNRDRDLLVNELRGDLADVIVDVKNGTCLMDVLSYDALFTGFSYFDRFIAAVPTTTSWNLHAIRKSFFTCQQLAAKFHGSSRFSILCEFFCVMDGNAYTPSDMRKTELDILEVLRWDISTHSPALILKQLCYVITQSIEPSRVSCRSLQRKP